MSLQDPGQGAADQRDADTVVANTKFVRLLWCDFSGTRRTRVVPWGRWEELQKTGLGVAYACMFLPASGDACPPDPAAKPVGEMRLVPVPDTLRPLPWHPSHALALTTSHPETDVAGPAWECCPRSALARVLQQAQQEHGITLKVGFESEFILLDGKAKQQQQQHGPHAALPPPIDHSVYCLSSAMDAAATVLDAMCDALQGWGIEVEQLHPEAAPGQFELVTRYGDALQACDNVLLTREAIAAVAAQHRMIATFLPKLWPDAAGNGAHCHFSVWKDGENLMSPSGDKQLSPVGEAFLAGVLHNLPALLCFTAPLPNSYRRLQPSTWSGAFTCWGVQNREAALRLASSPGSSAFWNCEYKAFDATANPYLGLAALVVAGLQGIKKGMTLPPALDADPGTLSPAELASRSIRRLPSDLGQAMQALKQNTEFCAALDESLGATLVRAFGVVRQVEWKAFGRKPIKEEALALYTRY